MALNTFAEIEIGKIYPRNLQLRFADLLSNSASIVGTSYKGKAFVPTLISNSGDNNLQNVLGTNRQNLNQHMFDEFTCYNNNPAYFAANAWLANGGDLAYFTRVLGIGSGKKNLLTGKMKGSGFRADVNCSFGTLDHTRSSYRFSNESEASGSTLFVLTKIKDEEYDRASATDANNNISRIGHIDLYSELGITKSDYFLTDVLILNQGITASFDSIVNNYDLGSLNTTGGVDLTTDTVLKENTTDTPILLKGYNPTFVEKMTSSSFKKNYNGFFLRNNDRRFNLKPSSIYDDDSANKLSSLFFEKGYFTYSSFPLVKTSLSDFVEQTILLQPKSLTDQGKESFTDYNSWESQYTVAKTPWVTSQPLDRSEFTEDVEGITYDCRKNIHSKVKNLFKFWALDDGEIGNRFRIKVNIKKRGDNNISNIKVVHKSKVDLISQNYSKYLSTSNSEQIINQIDDYYTQFDVHVFEYDPRVNDFTLAISFNDLNLNPVSPRYIGRVVGTKNTYYDFDENKVVEKGIYPNTNIFVRVEINEDIENILYENQHMLLPTGFRSYPHIKLYDNSGENLTKESFSLYTEANTPANIESLFDNKNIKQMPPQYSLVMLKDYTLPNPDSFAIKNSWGTSFYYSKIITFSTPEGVRFPPFTSHIDLNPTVNSLPENNHISPHYYYTKFFLNNCNQYYQNIWVEEDNYLNSFFHLEKICTKTKTVDDVRVRNSFFIVKDFNEENDNLNNVNYKHSGNRLSDENHYYINVDDTESDLSIWKSDRSLKTDIENKLSFDMFTCGGFNGTDIRDPDKKSINNDAITREYLGEDESSVLDGATKSSVEKAIDIAFNDAYSSFDYFVTPGIDHVDIISNCLKKIEEKKNSLFITNTQGALKDQFVTFSETINGETIDYFSAFGIMGSYYDVSTAISDYVKDASKTIDDNFDFNDLDDNTPKKVYNISYEDLLNGELGQNIQNMPDLWSNLSFTSRYLFSTYGNLKVSSDELKFEMSPETYVLGQLAKFKNLPNTDISELKGLSMFDLKNINFSLINGSTLFKDTLDNEQTFLTLQDKAKKHKVNLLVYRNNTPQPCLNTQLTSYEINKSIFTKQNVIRSLNFIKKRIKFNLFLNQDFIQGGFLFSQNNRNKNLNQLLEIQLTQLLNQFVAEDLISDFKIDVPNIQDASSINDMQNYILRGNIVLQFNTLSNNTIINLNLSDILNELSFLTTELNDTIVLPIF